MLVTWSQKHSWTKLALQHCIRNEHRTLQSIWLAGQPAKTSLFQYALVMTKFAWIRPAAFKGSSFDQLNFLIKEAPICCHVVALRDSELRNILTTRDYSPMTLPFLTQRVKMKISICLLKFLSSLLLWNSLC